jgi:hypothetical protein
MQQLTGKDSPIHPRPKGRGFSAFSGKALGSFNTKEEASAAYEAAARELHGEFYRKPNQR